jgi:hypothetical protein
MNREALELTQTTRQVIRRLFPGDMKEVADLLGRECGRNLPLMSDANERSLERVQLAALKIGNGDIDALFEAIRIAQIDWRDVLVAAEFAASLTAHTEWAATILS